MNKLFCFRGGRLNFQIILIQPALSFLMYFVSFYNGYITSVEFCCSFAKLQSDMRLRALC